MRGQFQQQIFDSQKDASTSASTTHQNLERERVLKKERINKPFGYSVGKDKGNPEYRKNVIQLEKERIEKERYELMMKKKRNSNYIQ